MLIVEDGTGLANSESYESVANADAFHLKRGNTVWGTLSETRKEQLLRQATDYITYVFGPSFIGIRAVLGQALAWPRQLSDGGYLFSLGVPREIKQATVELALIAHTTALSPNQTGAAKKKVKVGPIEVEYDTSSFNGPRFVSATSLLASFMDTRSGGMTARLVRT